MCVGGGRVSVLVGGCGEGRQVGPCIRQRGRHARDGQVGTDVHMGRWVRTKLDNPRTRHAHTTRSPPPHTTQGPPHTHPSPPPPSPTCSSLNSIILQSREMRRASVVTQDWPLGVRGGRQGVNMAGGPEGAGGQDAGVEAGWEVTAEAEARVGFKGGGDMPCCPTSAAAATAAAEASAAVGAAA